MLEYKCPPPKVAKTLDRGTGRGVKGHMREKKEGGGGKGEFL